MRARDRVAVLRKLAQLSLDNTMVLERLQGTGRLTTKTAREMQVVGMAARASGIEMRPVPHPSSRTGPPACAASVRQKGTSRRPNVRAFSQS